jgi:hypothetical protein
VFTLNVHLFSLLDLGVTDGKEVKKRKFNK